MNYQPIMSFAATIVKICFLQYLAEWLPSLSVGTFSPLACRQCPFPVKHGSFLDLNLLCPVTWLAPIFAQPPLSVTKSKPLFQHLNTSDQASPLWISMIIPHSFFFESLFYSSTLFPHVCSSMLTLSGAGVWRLTVCAQMSITPARRCHIHLRADVYDTCEQVYITPASRCI